MIRKLSFKIARFTLLITLGFSSLAAIADDSKDVWVAVRSPNFVVVSNAGEKEARHLAQQFEEFRGVLGSYLPKTRMDLGRPVVVIAAKNESTMKALLPSYWEVKGHVHPAGLYVGREEKDYIIVQTDIQGENPYHVVYHEYTHAIMHLNFQGLPPWFDEGFAEFCANAEIGEKKVKIGRPDPSHLVFLQRKQLIPIDQLVQVDYSSPYYNEQNRTSVFYAESWALMHYLLLDGEARKKDLFDKFLNAWAATGNQVTAAQQTFGDLKQFGRKMESYIGQPYFNMNEGPAPLSSDEKSYPSRTLSQAESMAIRGDFYLRTNRMQEAQSFLTQAVSDEPKLATAREAMGAFYLRQRDNEDAEEELREAVELDPANYVALYELAVAYMQERGGVEDRQKAQAALTKVINIHSSFAPAFARLATLYSINPEKQSIALDAAQRARQLEPGNLYYAVSLGYVLLNMEKYADARALATSIAAAARNPGEMQMARSFQETVEARARVNPEGTGQPSVHLVQRPKAAETTKDKNEEDDSSTESTRTTDVRAPAKESQPTVDTNKIYQMTGEISGLDCSKAPEVALTLGIGTLQMKLHSGDLTKLQISSGASDRPASTSCTQWNARKAKISYHLTPGKAFDGEIVGIQFLVN
jgi:tetratricopeptide (TPR) repeat protein